jgi:hypothetical protein
MRAGGRRVEDDEARVGVMLHRRGTDAAGGPVASSADAGPAGTSAEGSSVWTVARVVGEIAAPATVVAALGFYIGTVRQATFAGYFGLDVSVLGLSTRDYALRSTDALVPFLLGVSLLVLLLVLLWSLAGSVLHQRPEFRHAAVWGALALGTAGILAGVWRFERPVPLEGAYLVGPLSLGLGALLVAGAIHEFAATTHVGGRHLQRHVAVAATAATLVLVLLALFWAANDVARAQGGERAVELAGGLGVLPEVVLHSDAPLYLTASGVEVETLSTDDGGHHYRYLGLRLLVRGGDKFFLVPASWTRETGAVVVVDDDHRVRLEFGRGGRT